MMNRMHWHIILGLALNAGLLFASLLQQPALAYSPEGDLMKVKGYSPELIQMTDTQRSRQEWKQAAMPTKTPVEHFFHNIYYGEWTGGVDDFGSQVLRPH